MAGLVDNAAAVGEHGYTVEGDGGVEGVSDEEVPVVEGGGEDFYFDLPGLCLRFWNILKVQSEQKN